MKLKKLKDAVIFPDGGSLEASWLTEDDQDFYVTLQYQHTKSEENSSDFYALYFCDAYSTKQHFQIIKDSQAYQDFMEMVKQWMSEHNFTLEYFKLNESTLGYDQAYNFFVALEKGNY
ncbi:hypothetical protein [Acinetobacter sp. CFCC 10889]|uniref:hypothetical protein n=1 Tax=Acinetobacter sp. CFCC 10889 TaxID=1775557 RepID=UPI000DD0C926|nr:hypothetical protein [Acinetobacter sp. CFCC 10889]